MESKEPAIIEMTISSATESMLKESPFFLENEMLQGERIYLEDGGIEYRIEIHDTDKIETFKQFMLMCISNSHDINGN